MATFRGHDGQIKIGGATVAAVQSWNVDTTADVVEGSAMGEEWKTNFATFKGWSGSVEAYLDPADAGQIALAIGATVALELYPGGDVPGLAYFSGQAVINGTPRSGAKDGIPTITFNFTGTGPLAQAVAA